LQWANSWILPPFMIWMMNTMNKTTLIHPISVYAHMIKMMSLDCCRLDSLTYQKFISIASFFPLNKYQSSFLSLHALLKRVKRIPRVLTLPLWMKRFNHSLPQILNRMRAKHSKSYLQILKDLWKGLMATIMPINVLLQSSMKHAKIAASWRC